MPPEASTSTPSSFGTEQPGFPVTRPGQSYSPPTPGQLARGARARRWKSLAAGLGFLAPNILGFLAFTAVPLVFSLVLAFSNWDLRLHNMFALRRDPSVHIKFVGLDNFILLFKQPDFFRFLGNTLYLMIGMPFGIAASLFAAILLSKDLSGGSRRARLILLGGGVAVAGIILVLSTILLAVGGYAGTGMIVLFIGLIGGILLMGVSGGTTIYRTLFYIPNFVAGVATFLLWKKLYAPRIGPASVALAPVLSGLTDVVNSVPPAIVRAGLWTCLLLTIGLMGWGLHRLRRFWADGDVGWFASLLSGVPLVLPALLTLSWYGVVSVTEQGITFPGLTNTFAVAAIVLAVATVMLVAWTLFRAAGGDRTFTSSPAQGVGTGLIFAGAIMVAEFVLIGLGATLYVLPNWAKTGLVPPEWLASAAWAKPSIMIMGFWAAVGSNTMLLYLAALSNVPQELYEAADIDGASRFQKFWNVTWPQLAPTTFFIVVMGVIGGLQGGFEMARTMTEGGPAGSTTTLAYYIYNEGFQTGRLGFSSAVAWTLFLMVFVITLFNWKFGNKYVND